MALEQVHDGGDDDERDHHDQQRRHDVLALLLAHAVQQPECPPHSPVLEGLEDAHQPQQSQHLPR